MMHIPAHKNVNNPPGQIKNDLTLGDYIARKQREEAFNSVAEERKLHFADWYTRNKHLINYNYDQAHLIWIAAQENK